MDSKATASSSQARSSSGATGDRHGMERSDSAIDKETAALNARVPFSSKLCNLSVSIQPRPPVFEFDFADYCIGDSSADVSKILYKDGCISLSREDFRSFEPDCALISPPVISAWGRTLNHKWGQRGTLHACMDLVNMDVASFNYEDVMVSWRKWLKASDVEISNCEIVFIPVRHEARTFVLVVNFIKRRLHCFDTEDRPNLYKIVQEILCVYSRLLKQMDDRRAVELRDFEIFVSYPHCAMCTKPEDGGMLVMQVMECFNGTNYYILDVAAAEKCLFLGKRITYCTRIAISSLNNINVDVVAGVAKRMKTILHGKP